MRAFLCSAALLGLATFCFAADAKDTKDTKNDQGILATITKVDAKKNTVTLQWKDNNGKSQEQTFNLTNDGKLSDENGKPITAGALKDGEDVRFTQRDGKLVDLRPEKASNYGEEATITKVDPKNGTVTVRMNDKNGKEVERTFTLTEDARYFDGSGRVAALDVFQSGNDVLVVEEQGKLKQMTKKNKEEKKPNK